MSVIKYYSRAQWVGNKVRKRPRRVYCEWEGGRDNSRIRGKMRTRTLEGCMDKTTRASGPFLPSKPLNYGVAEDYPVESG